MKVPRPSTVTGEVTLGTGPIPAVTLLDVADGISVAFPVLQSHAGVAILSLFAHEAKCRPNESMPVRHRATMLERSGHMTEAVLLPLIDLVEGHAEVAELEVRLKNAQRLGGALLATLVDMLASLAFRNAT